MKYLKTMKYSKGVLQICYNLTSKETLSPLILNGSQPESSVPYDLLSKTAKLSEHLQGNEWSAKGANLIQAPTMKSFSQQ